WCGPCISSFPHLSELQEQYADDVVILSVSDEKLDTVQAFLAKEKHASVTHYTMGTDPDRSMYADWMNAAKMRGIPTAFIVERGGIVQYIGHPMGMDAALQRVVSGEAPPAAEAADIPEMDTSALFAVEGAHSEAALEQLDELQQRLSAPGGELNFEQKFILKGALKTAESDSEAMDLKMSRKGRAILGGELGLRVEVTSSMELPGMLSRMPGSTEQKDVIIEKGDHIVARRSSASRFGMPSPLSDGWMGLSRKDAQSFADERPTPLPAQVMMDDNPVFASPLHVLARVVELSALSVASEAGSPLVLEGQGAVFLGMPAPPEDPTEMGAMPKASPQDVRITVLASGVSVIIGDPAAPQFSMTITRTEAVIDEAVFSTGDEPVGDLLKTLREHRELTNSMSEGMGR
ncbi:MAG: hypothetical protein ACI9EF_003304, partial [Pseudohongiellaceae bacterium]